MSRKLIGQEGVCQVQICACGSAYVTIGPVTITLHPSALRDVAAATGQAAATLEPPHEMDLSACSSADADEPQTADEMPVTSVPSSSDGRSN